MAGYIQIPSADYSPCTSIGVVGGPGSLKIVEAARLINKASFAFTTPGERELGAYRYGMIAAEQDPRVDADEHRLSVDSPLLDKLGENIPLTVIKNGKPSDISKGVEDDMRAVLLLDIQYFQGAGPEGKHNQLAYEVEQLKKQGLMVVFSGIDKWFNGAPAEPTATMLCLAEKVKKVYSNCKLCDGPTKNVGTHTLKYHRGKNGGPELASHTDELLHRAGDTYKSVCLEHFIEQTDVPAYQPLKGIRSEYKSKVGMLPRFKVIGGPMKSGKSSGIITEIVAASENQGLEKMFFKPKTDTRFSDAVSTRFGASPDSEFSISYPATEVCSESDLMASSETEARLVAELASAVKDEHGTAPVIVGIDEAWMMDSEELMLGVNHLRLLGYPVIAAALDSDFAKRPAGSTPYLLCNATEVETRSASCECGNRANYTQRFSWDRNKQKYAYPSYDDPIISIEVAEEKRTEDSPPDKYEPACLFCHTVKDTPPSWH